ncbi:MAG: site-2 protease family protein [Chloroflexi bacterium]|nr:site-2 protease family protein [Chloroflexota bacterium]
MRSALRIGRIMGIDINLDVSWFLIVLLMVYALGFVQFPRELRPNAFFPRADWLSITLGLATTLLLFASVLAHELAHSWMALARGIPVTRITLFIFGGVAQIADEPERPATEFLIAVMGPLMSLVLAILFGGAWLWLSFINGTHWLDVSLAPLILPAGILAQANGSLVLFNLAPGFPLDGGRVLRAALWGAWRDVRRATKWASRAGQALAILMVGGGVILFFVFSDGSGIWYALIGFFLWNAAGQGYRQTLLIESLRNVTVAQLMVRGFPRVAPEILVTEFIEQHLLPVRDQVFAVMAGEEFRGVISIEQIKRLARAEWNVRRVSEVMLPRERLAVLDPQQTGAKALARLSASESDDIAVIEGGALVGFVGRAELTRFIELDTTSK